MKDSDRDWGTLYKEREAFFVGRASYTINAHTEELAMSLSANEVLNMDLKKVVLALVIAVAGVSAGSVLSDVLLKPRIQRAYLGPDAARLRIASEPRANDEKMEKTHGINHATLQDATVAQP